MRRTLALPLALALGALTLGAPALGADDAAPQVSITAAVVPQHPAVNDTVRVTYTFSGKDAGGSLRVPPSLPLKGLSVVGGPATSTSIQMFNMDVTRTVAVTYFLRPHGQGPAEVGEVTFEIGGKPVKAAAVPMDVGPPRAGPPQGEEQEPEDPFERFFGQRRMPSPRDRSAGLDVPMRGQPPVLEYLVTPDKTTAYVGEEITLTWELVTQVDVDGLEPVDPPKFPGCWAEDLERPEHPTGRRDTYEGKPVMRFLLQKKVVSGLAAGTVTLPPAKVRLAVRGGGDPFGDPFGFMRRQVVERTTKPLTLKFLPIPGAHGDFKGPVGKFDVSARVEPAHVPAGSAATLKVKVSGVGNLRAATDPPQVSVPGARLYPPTRSGEPQRAPGKSASSVEWSYVLVPEKPGALAIPPVALETFDPAAKRIVTKTTAPLTLAVEAPAPGALAAAPGTASTASAPVGAAETEQPALERRAVSERPTPTPSGPRAVNLEAGTVAVPIWLLAAIPGGLLLLGAGAVLVRRRLRTNEALLGVIAPEPDETKERVAARIERSLRALLAARGVPEALPAAQVPEAMRAAGEPEARIAAVKDLLDDLEFLRFAPQLGEYGERIREAREKAARLLPKLR